MSLDTQTKKFSLVINFPKDTRKECEVLAKVKAFSMKMEEYYYIVHDKDYDEFGTLKTKHIHWLFRIKEKQKRLKTVLNEVNNELFNGSDQTRSLISIESWKNYEATIQYLVHKNNPEKYQYKVEEVHTNDFETLKQVMDYAVDTNLTIDKIKYLCTKNTTLCGVLEDVGLINARNYLNVIRTIWEEYLRWSNSQDKRKELPF